MIRIGDRLKVGTGSNVQGTDSKLNVKKENTAIRKTGRFLGAVVDKMRSLSSRLASVSKKTPNTSISKQDRQIFDHWNKKGGMLEGDVESLRDILSDVGSDTKSRN